MAVKTTPNIRKRLIRKLNDTSQFQLHASVNFSVIFLPKFSSLAIAVGERSNFLSNNSFFPFSISGEFSLFNFSFRGGLGVCRVGVMFYGSVVWDPWLIVAQIVCLQCLYYITLGLFLSILVGTRVSRLSLVYFFDYVAITTSTITGWCVIASFLLSSLAGAVYVFYLIERSKKCLDFSATIYIVHLFICIVYGGWPSSITWWIVNGTGIAVMALLGERLCMKRELQEISLTRFRSNV
ncbi:Protein SYS1 [Glycine max]|nr:Protein SYS1 [Glycine max]